MKRFLYIGVGLVAGLIMAGGVAYAASGGVFDNSVQDQAVQQQNNDTGRLITKQPAPHIDYSVERQNLIERYKTFSDKNKISYIALLGQNGNVIFTGVVKGKISATSSQLTPADRVQCTHDNADGVGCGTVQVPEPDGTWSTNGSAEFWFDDHDVYHEWNGLFLTADAPFQIASAPLLTITATAPTPSATK